ncbi:MAG: hypothetical protein Q9169_006685 [Polycauliona sp. 2 TL-2023]
MRLPRWITLATTSLFTRHTLASICINLSDLQPISGFSDACTEAYNSPLTDCTLSDFYQGNACSPSCVAFLEDRTQQLNDECEGITAFPDTLIGMFFKKTAVEQLCAGTEDMTDSSDGRDSIETATVESTPARSSSSTTSTVIETATMTATSTSLSAVPSRTSSTRTTVVPSSTANAGQSSGDGSSTATAVPGSSTSPSDAQEGSTNTDPDNGSGDAGGNDAAGGTVLEAASKANVKSIPGLSLITACLVLAMCAS